MNRRPVVLLITCISALPTSIAASIPPQRVTEAELPSLGLVHICELSLVGLVLYVVNSDQDNVQGELRQKSFP